MARYRELAANLGNWGAGEIEASREVIREIATRIPVRPGADGVPIAVVTLSGSVAGAGVAQPAAQDVMAKTAHAPCRMFMSTPCKE